MNDIVERLRAEATDNRRYEVNGTLAVEAADEITRLRAENERLRAALEQLLACPAIADGNHNDPAWACHETAAAETFARKVLAPPSPPSPRRGRRKHD